MGLGKSDDVPVRTDHQGAFFFMGSHIFNNPVSSFSPVGKKNPDALYAVPANGKTGGGGSVKHNGYFVGFDFFILDKQVDERLTA